MLQITLRFSGVLATLFAWLFVVTPAIRFGIDGKRQTITSTTKDNKVKRIISIGLVVGALLQTVFLFYIIQRFQLHLTDLGCLMYLSTNVATILVAFFTEQKHPKIHEALTEYYFVINPLSLVFIGLSAVGNYFYIFIFSFLIVLFYFFGIWRLLKKFGKAAIVEQWAFFVLSIWTIVLTII